jgi:hypothetical protein
MNPTLFTSSNPKRALRNFFKEAFLTANHGTSVSDFASQGHTHFTPASSTMAPAQLSAQLSAVSSGVSSGGVGPAVSSMGKSVTKSVSKSVSEFVIVFMVVVVVVVGLQGVMPGVAAAQSDPFGGPSESQTTNPQSADTNDADTKDIVVTESPDESVLPAGEGSGEGGSGTSTEEQLQSGANDLKDAVFGWVALIGKVVAGFVALMLLGAGVLAAVVSVNRRRMLRTVTYFMLRPKTGGRSEDVDVEAAMKPATAAVGTGELSVVRWSRNGVVSTGLAMCNVKNPRAVADGIAEAVGCEATQVDVLDPNGLPHGELLYARRRVTDALGAVEAPLPKYAEYVTAALANSSEDALIIFTMSKMKKWEHRRLRANLSNDEASQVGARARFTSLGTATAKASASTTLRCRVVARCENPEEGEALLASAASLDMWPHDARPATFRNVRWSVPMVIFGAFGFLSSVLGWVGGLLVPLSIIIGAIGVVATITNFPALTDRAMQRWTDTGVVFTERPWNLSPRWHFVSRLRSRRDSDPSEDEAYAPKNVRFSHPFTRRMLTISPDQVAGVCYPPPALITTIAEGPAALAIPAPRAVTETVGARLGFDVASSTVRLAYRDRYGGMVAVGAPGTGKTTLVLNVLADDALSRKWGVGDGQGALRNGNMTLLCLDVKGDIANRAVRLLQTAGYQPNEYTVLDLTNPQGMRINWLDVNNPKLSAERFVDALEYASPEGAVGGENKPYLTMLLTITASVDDQLAQQLGLYPFDPVRAALILAGGDANPEAQTTLFNRLMTIMNADVAPTTPMLTAEAAGLADELNAINQNMVGSATDAADPLNPDNNKLSQRWPVLHRALLDFGGFMRLPARERDARMRSTINRLRELITNPHLFVRDTYRPAVSIDQIISSHRPVVVNVRGDGFAMTESSVTRVASLFLHLLWSHARQQCIGWQQQGRSMTVYCDELASISGAGSGDDVIRDMFDQGRSLGIEAVYALQRYSQLPPRTQSAIRNFAHKVVFRLPDPESAVEAHRSLSLEESPWTTQTIQTLPDYNAVARVSAAGVPQPPFTLNITNDAEWDPRTFPAGGA